MHPPKDDAFLIYINMEMEEKKDELIYQLVKETNITITKRELIKDIDNSVLDIIGTQDEDTQYELLELTYDNLNYDFSYIKLLNLFYKIGFSKHNLQRLIVERLLIFSMTLEDQNQLNFKL